MYRTQLVATKGTVMEQLNALSMGRKLILGAGALLLIDTFFHWQSVTVHGWARTARAAGTASGACCSA